MSYTTKKSTGQRSIGLIAVVALHVLLIQALAAGMTGHNTRVIIDKIINFDVIEETQPEIELPVPPPVPTDTSAPTPDFVSPPAFDYVPEIPVPFDAPVPVNAIKQIQHEDTGAANLAHTRARQTDKRLSHPLYPPKSAKLGEQGVTRLNLSITEDGKVSQALVMSSSGYHRLDETIKLHAVRFWKFIPCTRNAKPVACWLSMDFRWAIENAEKSGTWVNALAENRDYK